VSKRYAESTRRIRRVIYICAPSHIHLHRDPAAWVDASDVKPGGGVAAACAARSALGRLTGEMSRLSAQQQSPPRTAGHHGAVRPSRRRPRARRHPGATKCAPGSLPLGRRASVIWPEASRGEATPRPDAPPVRHWTPATSSLDMARPSSIAPPSSAEQTSRGQHARLEPDDRCRAVDRRENAAPDHRALEPSIARKMPSRTAPAVTG
jgi:hypothetical protein